MAAKERNEAGTTDRKIAGQKNGMPAYLYVPHFSVSRSSIRFPRSLRARIAASARSWNGHFQFLLCSVLVF
jgi:hypothetical protein